MGKKRLFLLIVHEKCDFPRPNDEFGSSSVKRRLEGIYIEAAKAGRRGGSGREVKGRKEQL